ncbi:ribose-5-phosphate isomerase RpiA [Methylocystis bryophila]|uniref:Ribose-5-phosphate isomerase A n=1 Tax=Methylocystis bryophila TaxID=655015 RepID=A0A1W6MWV3_9HYPH|nr:ribose-5-phosphate isomerase RpiA [Methylocystis bryophila]ARN81999.1 ribose 5-phosphate isomerase A [Methylocystis bryophila]BDV38108.1 ribose-5-phosphate isomerase A [Methylocystis bryophila]
MNAIGTDGLKRQAAEAALAFVRPGMRLGLGTGSTAAHFVELLGAKAREGLELLCVPTSEATRAQAERCGLKLTTLDDYPELDLTVDGADEFDERLRLIKGGGGALLREKIVASASKRMVVIADASKRVATLGAFALPVEIVPFGARSALRRIEAVAQEIGLVGKAAIRLTSQGTPFLTDGGNSIVDCAFGAIPDPEAFAQALDATVGVIEHGLFIGIASSVLVASESGVETLGESPSA